MPKIDLASCESPTISDISSPALATKINSDLTDKSGSSVENQPIIQGFGNYEKKKKGIFFEGKCFLKTKTDHLKTHWVVVDGNEVFCYRKQGDGDHRVMHCLAGTFV
jgi:hypothetical protein